MGISIKQASDIRVAVRQLVMAEIHNSWKGSASKEDRPIIETQLKSAKARFGVILARCTDKKAGE